MDTVVILLDLPFGIGMHFPDKPNLYIILHSIRLSIIEPRSIIEFVLGVIRCDLDSAHRETPLPLSSERNWLFAAVYNSVVLGVNTFLVDSFSTIG